MSLKINYTTGYAGTGKSTNLLKLLDTLNVDDTIVLAPTHKALHRLRQEYKGSIELKTIHSLLGLIPRVNEDATKVAHIDTIAKLDKDLGDYKHIVIDEAGMIAEDYFLDLIAKIEEPILNNPDLDRYMYVYLDPYQLLPVKGQQIQTDPDTTTNLTKQYRSDSPDIVRLYTKFVEYLQEPHGDLTTPYSENVLPLDITKFKVGDRLLCFTNEAVGKWNTKIAKHLGITSHYNQECIVGNSGMFVVYKADKPSITELVNLYEAGELNLQNSQISKKFVKYSLHQLLDNKHIEWATINNKLTPIIIGVDKSYKLIKEIKKKCIKDKKNYKHLYTINRAFVIDYNFATTVHKSQGSEFSTIFIDKQNMLKSVFNNSYIMYARLMYVAISRTKTKLYIS